MKKAILLLCCFAGIIPMQIAAASNGQPPTGLDVSVKEISSQRFVVSINNHADHPLRIWHDSNSWGAAHWRVLVLQNGRIQTIYQNPIQLFTKNSPGFFELKVNETRTQVLNFSDGHWVGLDGTSLRVSAGSTIVVIFDVPPTPEGSKLGVWYGVAATTYKVP